MQNSATFCSDVGGIHLGAESCARIIYLVENEAGWKAAVTKNVLKVAIRRILALEVVCRANIDLPWDAIKDIE